MKFLIFNVTVAAALVYLLTTDRAEVQNTAGRIHDAATEMKQAAGRVVSQGRSLVGRIPADTALRPSSRATPPTSPITAPAIKAPAARARAPMPMRHATAGGQGQGKAAPPEIRHADAVARRAATGAVASAKEAAALKRRKEIQRGIDPAVLIPGARPKAETTHQAIAHAERRKRLYALSEKISAKEAAALKRRKEILRGIDPAVLIPGAKTEAETAPPALSPAERRKRLSALSEEMELFYARTLGK
jgi:hypothetical protein